jgi:alpha-glucosidase
MPVLYFSPLQAMNWYGSPDQYTDPVEIEFYKLIPTTWSETIYLKGELGKYVSIARRNGENWFLGNIAGTAAWKDAIRLSFLKSGVTYNTTIYADNGRGGIIKQVTAVKRNDILPIDIKPSEGTAVYFEPVKNP